MSEIKTLEVEVTHPDILDVDVDFGQTLTKIVAPEHYMGPFEFHVSDEDQIIPVKDKTPAEDICVKGITGEKTIIQNGTYSTLEYKTVIVDVPTTGYDKGTVVFDETLTEDTSSKYILTLPDGSDFSFDMLVVDFTNYVSSGNSGFRTYWSKTAYGGNFTNGMISLPGNTGNWTYPLLRAIYTIDESVNRITALCYGYDENFSNARTGYENAPTPEGFKKITMFGWWYRNILAGTHIKITGYNKTV